MRWLHDVWFRIRALVDRRRLETELDDEVAFHLEMEERKYRAQGMSPREARRLARVKFGGEERQKADARRSWGVGPLHDLAGDVRYALRQLVARPAYSVVATLTLALGIGGTVAIFSVAHGLLVRPLPVDDESELVVFWSDYNWRGVEFDFVKEHARAFEGLAAFTNDIATLRTEDATSMLLATLASAELFDVLGTAPLLGRTFQPGDDRPGADPSIVLSHGLWEQEFGGDRNVIGRRVTVDGAATTVIGVMPEGFHFPNPEMRAWLPLDLDPASGVYQGNGWLVLVGRTLEGVGPERLQQDLDAIASRLGERFEYPEQWDKSRNASAAPLREYLLGSARPAVILLLGAVGLLFLMACANVAALVLARTTDRTTELSVRAALGAGRARLARQVLTESVVLGLLGGALGLGLAVAAFDVLVSSLPLGQSTQGFAEALALDWPTLVAALGLSAVTGALISLAPMRALLRGDLSGAATGAAQRGRVGMAGRQGRVHQALVAAEVLLAVVLVSGAALLARSVDHLRSLDPGVDPEGVLAVDLHLGAEETSPEERSLFFDAIAERTRAMPGVLNAGLMNRLPIRDGGYQGGIGVEGRPDLTDDQRPTAYYRAVSPGALDALGIAPSVGRALAASDDEGAVRAALVNESFVRAFWPTSAAVGRHFTTSFGNSTEWQVVGVIPDVAIQGLTGEVRPAGYHPWSQAAVGATSAILVVRVDGDESALAAPIRGAVRALDPRAAVGRIVSMDEVVDEAMAESLRLRFFLVLFSALGVVLGVVGIYGVVSYGVERRRGEYGLRLALGARPRRLLAEVVARGMAPVAVGVVAGVAASLALARTASSVLFEVAPSDPVSLGASAVVLLLAGLSAALVPALRAMRTHPGVALRSE